MKDLYCFTRVIVEVKYYQKKAGRSEAWQIDFDIGKNEAREYKVEAMRKSSIYAQESKLDDLQGLHHLVS